MSDLYEGLGSALQPQRAPRAPAGTDLYEGLGAALDGPRPASGFIEHVQAGFQGSVAGPPGALAGGLALGGAAMFGAPAAIRQSLIEAYKARDAETPADWFNIVREVAKATAHEAAIGAVTMGAGSLAARTAGRALAPAIGQTIGIGGATRAIGAADVAAQIGAMVTMPAALDGRLPEAREFIDAAAVILTLKAGHTVVDRALLQRTTKRVTDTYVKTGKTPAEQVEAAKADARVAEDLTGPEVPRVPVPEIPAGSSDADVSVALSRYAESMQLRGSAATWAEKLPGLPRSVYEALSEISPADRGAKEEGQLQELRQRVLEAREAPEAAMRSVWGEGLADASPELRRAIERGLAMSETSLGGPRGIVSPTIQEALFRDAARINELEEAQRAAPLADPERAELVDLRARVASLEGMRAATEPAAPAERTYTSDQTAEAGVRADARLKELEAKPTLSDLERAERVFLTNAQPEAIARHFKLEAKAPSRAEADASAQRVHDEVLRLARDADQARKDSGIAPLGDEHAVAVAALVRARVRTRAARLGMDPWEVYNERPLQIRDETAAELKAAEEAIPADAPRYVPPETDLFGDPIEAPMVPRYAVENLATAELPIERMVLSKEVPQFKHAADALGVVVPLGGKFDRTGVGPIQVWERLDGTLEVISGRHRLDLARRSGEATIPAQVHREAEGFDARKAATLDAQLNIREEQGSVADYAQYFKDSAISKEAADERGLLARAKGRTGFAIARDASPDLLAAHRAGRLSDEAALVISTAAPGSERLQALGMAMVQEGKSALIAVNTMKAVDLMAAERMAEGAQGDIFGFDDSAMREASTMAKRASSIQRKIGEQISAVSGASKRPELARKMGVDVADPDGIQKRIVELRQEQSLWDNWPLHPELVAKLRAPEVTGREGELKQEPVSRNKEGISFGHWSPTDRALGAMRDIDSRVGKNFKKWLSKYLDNPEETKTALADPSLRLDYLNDYLGSELDISVRDDGRITIDHLPTQKVIDAVGDLPIVVFHHTSTGFLKSIGKEGLVPGKKSSSSYMNSKAGVYVTLRQSGADVEGYARNAIGRRKGRPVALEIETRLRDLVPDPDDADIQSGSYQYVLDRVRPDEILNLRESDPNILRQEPFDLKPETPAELAARNLEATEQAKRKLAEEAPGGSRGRALTQEEAKAQADLFNTQGTLFQEVRDYGGDHRPPGRQDGAPAHDLTGEGRIYPEDVYSLEGVRYYGHGGEDVALDHQTLGILHALRGKPNAKVKIYRAIPDDLTVEEKISKILRQKAYILKHGKVPPEVETGINSSRYYDQIDAELISLRALPTMAESKADIIPGDWVTVNRSYARQHGESALRGNYKIISKTVRADEIFTDGNSIHEFGYWTKGSEPEVRSQDLKQGNRASFQVAENLITIMQGADKSSVVHELGHSWLEEMRADAARPDAPAQLKADWETLRRELAIPEQGEIPVASHEQFARSTERYLGEGEAPSIELRSVFQRFREWLLDIYRDLANLNVRINPELKVVLDRMLATDEDIAAARELNVPVAYVAEAKATEARKIVPGFKAEQVSMEPYADELPRGPGEAPDSSHVNYAYINTPLDVKLTMQRMAEIDQANIQKQRGGVEGVKSWEQANAEQAKYVNDILGGGEDTLRLLSPRDPNAAGPDVKLGILKKLAVGAAKDSARLRDVVLEAGHDATIRQQLEYMGSIERARMIQAEFLGERASVARALNALKDVTEGSGEIGRMLDVIGYGEAAGRELFQSPRTPAEEQAYLKAKLDEILQNYRGRTALDIAKLHKEIGTLKGSYEFTRKLERATTWEMVVEGWKASLLSGPVTHTTNLFGTGAFQAMRAPVDFLAAVIGTARGASPGMGESDRASMSEAVARITGMLGGVQEGVRVAWATFKLDDPTGKTEAYRTAIPGRAGELMRIPLRLMGAEDAMVSTMYKRGELATLAIRQAFNEGLNPATREFAERVDALKDKPTPEMELAADAAATRMTFNMPLGEKGVALQLFVAKWNLQWVVPFIRTPINITKEVARMSPFAPLVGEWRADIAKGGVARDRAIAEITLGAGLMALTMGYAFSGQITGGMSPDPGKNRGKAGVTQPYSWKVGDTWYEYARIQPMGTLMGMAADIATAWDHMTDEEKDKIPKLLSRAFANAVTNQTFLQGITNVINAMSDPARFAPRFLQQMAGSMVPNVIGQPTAMADPVVREVNSALEAIQSRIPGLRLDLLPKRDWLGEEVKTKERLGVVGPVREQQITDDKVRLEAARLDISMAAAPKKTHLGKGTGKLGDVDLTPEERNTFAKVGGEMAHQILANIVTSEGYDQIPDLVKRRIFARVLTASHQVAAVAALPPEKRAALLQSISEKMAAELTQ